MSYMKWVGMIRDEAREQVKHGLHIGTLAARAKLQEYRLRDWLTKNTIDDLNYSELVALHEALTNGSSNNVTLQTESDATGAAGGGAVSNGGRRESFQLPFDESD